MFSKKLQTLLHTFSSSQKKTFAKYLKSPYFNENPRLVRLFALLEKEDLSAPRSKEEIGNLLFPQRNYTDLQLRRTASELTRLAENFLVQEEVKKRTSVSDILLLENLRDNALQQHFLQTYVKVKKFQTDLPQSPEYWFREFSTEMIKHEFQDKFAPASNKLQSLHAANAALDTHYLLVKLKFYLTYLNYKKATPQQSSFSLPADFIEHTKTSPSFDRPIIQLYYHIIKLLSAEEEDEAQLEYVRKILIDYADCTAVKELRNIYYSLQNYCAWEMNKGKVSFYRTTFDIYKTMIEQKILPGEEDLKHQVYKNIITLGLITEEFGWTERFIEKYTEKLPAQHRENAENYNLAKVYFHKKEYRKVIEQLREVEYNEPLYALGGKLMLLRTYFELDETRALDSLIDSFRIYLRRNQTISKTVRQEYLNSLRFTKKLANLAPYDIAGLQKLKQQTQNCKALAAKKWLLEKIAEKEK